MNKIVRNPPHPGTQCSTSFVVGEERRYAVAGRHSATFEGVSAIPITLKGVGGGPDLLAGQPAQGKPIGTYANFIEANKALWAWAWEFAENNAPKYR